VMERVGQFTLERYAYERGFSVVRTLMIELYDDRGETIGPHQMEIDALLVGLGSVREIADVKFDYDRVSPARQLDNLEYYYRKDLVNITPQKARAFGDRDWSSVRGIGVVAGGARMSLAEFQARYPRATAVSVVGLTTVPDVLPIARQRLTIGTMRGVTRAELIQLIIAAVTRYL
jgi:hypothetical protein